ncbi:glycosyltransferase family 4 protein [Magnetospirillum fulvum]|uniref:glycosyltransferase family 4 protein n=1 Tax=Magnetospirillum fulvum TaxID=1082 RepID=UPI00244EDC56|nr:glycosyltransferase family 4 protein [Magnetospirillum fulvum]
MRILYVVTEDWYFWSHRLPTARAARDMGFEVVVATHIDAHAEAITREGFRVVPIPSLRKMSLPFGPLAALFALVTLYRREKPDIIHHIALVPTLFGGLAAILAGTRHALATMTGLGLVFTAQSRKVRVLRAVVTRVLRWSLAYRRSDLVFQNGDDLAYFTGAGIVPPERAHLIAGSGVDIAAFHPMAEPEGEVVAAYVGRMLRPKGVLDIVAAARLLKQQGAPVRIVLVGGPDTTNPESLGEDDLRRWQAEGVVEWWGVSDDVAALWRQAHIALLPSYREGLPKSLLEAAACGRPMIATDVPGCRDVVQSGETGLLVPLQDGAALAEAILTLAKDGEARRRMGHNARAQVERRFANAVIATQMQALYREIISRR